MGKAKVEAGYEKSKNIKNIYVQKINSLIKISRDNLAEENFEVFSQVPEKEKKIKKSVSDTLIPLSAADKNSFKLQKNRESARKARQRKNMYIKLLEKHVEDLQKNLKASQEMTVRSNKYLNLLTQLKTPNDESEMIEQDLDKYISDDNIASLSEQKKARERRIAQMSETVEEIKQLTLSEIQSKINKLTYVKKEELKKYKSSIKQSEPELFNKIEQIIQQIEKCLKTLKTLNQEIKALMLSSTCESNELKLMNERMRSIFSELEICGVRFSAQDLLVRKMKANNVTVYLSDAENQILEYDRFLEQQQQHQKQHQKQKQKQGK